MIHQQQLLLLQTPGTTLGARMIHQQQLLLLQHQEQHLEQEWFTNNSYFFFNTRNNTGSKNTRWFTNNSYFFFNTRNNTEQEHWMIHQQQLLLLQHQEQHWEQETLDDSPTIATSSSTPGTTPGDSDSSATVATFFLWK